MIIPVGNNRSPAESEKHKFEHLLKPILDMPRHEPVELLMLPRRSRLALLQLTSPVIPGFTKEHRSSSRSLGHYTQARTEEWR